MGISAERQLYAFLYAVLIGILCGGLYDVVRISRVLFGIAGYTGAGKWLYARVLPLIGTVRSVTFSNGKQVWKRVLLFAGDLFFGAAAGCVFSVYLYHFASGCFRWFYLMGCGIGFLLYYLTAGRLVMFSSEVLVFSFKAALRYIFWFVLAPLRFLLWILRRLGAVVYARVCLPVIRSVRKRWLKRYTRRVRLQLASAIRISLTDPP